MKNMKRKLIKIERIEPPIPQRVKFSLEEIIEAAKKVKEAVEKEGKRDGRAEFA